MTVLIVIAILVLLIVTHEFGHFLAAKLFRVKVEEFGIGYPPRAFLFGKWGDTEYTLNWIPFGGFVRLFGEDEVGVHGKGSYADAARWKQIVILAAGVVANALVAYLLFAWAFTLGVPRIIDNPDQGARVVLMVSDVVLGSPADAGGLIPGDQVVAVESLNKEKPKSLTPEAVTDFVKKRGGQSIVISYVRNGATSTTSVKPANAVVPGEAGRPALGVGLVLVGTTSLSWPAALSDAFMTTVRAFGYVGQSLWNLVADALRGQANLSQIVGPIGLVSVIGDASHNGAGYVVQLAAFIAVNLAIINLIPIPALDGGRLLITVIEALMRRPASHLAIQILNTLGIAIIILLMITVTFNDIVRLIT